MKMRPFLLSFGCLTLLSVTAVAQTPSALICRNKQCITTSAEMNREPVFIKLAQLLDKNKGKKIKICEADPTTHRCLTPDISFETASNTIQTNLAVSSAQIIDSQIIAGATGVDLILDYNIKAGDTYPRCQAANTRLAVSTANNIQMISPQFSCRLTQTGSTILSMVYQINYADVADGTIGAYYSAATGEALSGGKKGYLLLQLPEKLPIDLSDSFFKNARPIKNIASGNVNPFLGKPTGVAHTQVDPVWMKPTPFLNMETPVVLDDCASNPAGCSAPVLATNMGVPTANPKPNLPNDPSVASTTGLVQQTKSVIPPLHAVRKRVTTRKEVIDSGTPVYAEEETRFYTQETPDSPLVEDAQAAIKTTTGINPFADAETQEDEVEEESTDLEVNSFSEEDITEEINEAPIVNEEQTVQIVIPQEEATPELLIPNLPQPAVLPPDPYFGGAQVEIITQNGVVLSPSEQSYIQQMPLAPETVTAIENIQQGTSQQAPTEQELTAPLEGLPLPTEAEQNSCPDCSTAKDNTSKTEEEPSLWNKLEKYIYF